MRLLNARTYEFHDVLGAIKPKYAILSHTWEDGEVLFEDVRDTSRAKWSAKKGYFKIRKTCEQALQDGCEFVWIDTCNINKDSSAELSEAINSMFRWYCDAVICYAYISDIIAGGRRSLSECRWLTRGWTLQEMIAPDRVHFYDVNWDYLGSRISLAAQLSESSGIHASVLLRRHSLPTIKVPTTTGVIIELGAKKIRAELEKSECRCCKSAEEQDVRAMMDRFSVAQKMKWASKRTTTREEDIAYCLMGLFDANMPLLYGEGKKAFYRLQKAILEISSDHSILAFHTDPSVNFFSGQPSFLAPDPTSFCYDIQNMHMPDRGTHISFSGATLSVEMLLCPLGRTPWSDYLGILDCAIDGDPYTRPAILLSPVDRTKLIFRRRSGEVSLFRLGPKHPKEAAMMFDNQWNPKGLRWDTQRMSYDPSTIERARITLVGEETTNQNLRHAKAPIRVRISPIFHELRFQVTSLPPLVAEHLPDATSRTGSIEISSTQFGGFYVNWNRTSPGQLECSISTKLLPGGHDTIQEWTAAPVDLEFEPRDVCTTTPSQHLCESKQILLRGIESAQLKVWFAIFRELFIGRSSFELAVWADLFDENEKWISPAEIRHKWGRNLSPEPTPLPIKMDDEPLSLSHRQRDRLLPENEEHHEKKEKTIGKPRLTSLQ